MAEESKNSKTPLGVEAAQIVRDLAKASVGAQLLSQDIPGLGAYPPKIPFLYDAEGHKGVSLKPLLEEFRLRPERREGTATVETLKSFMDLLKRHKTDNSVIFAKTIWPEPRLTAVIDYHGADAEHTPAYMKHRIIYAFPVTDEFKAWIDADSKPMGQMDFAVFIDAHVAELTPPTDGERSEYEQLFKGQHFATPSELVVLSRELEITSDSSAKQAFDPKTGERTIFYKEEHMTGEGRPLSDLPGIFMVKVPAFRDGEPVRLPARLRTRKSGDRMLWFYELYRWEWWLRDRVFHDMTLAATETGLPAYEGAPEK